MINEILYMETRVFHQFCEKYKVSYSVANKLFKDCLIWKYIEECYGMLHLNGDDYILNDISQILSTKGIKL